MGCTVQFLLLTSHSQVSMEKQMQLSKTSGEENAKRSCFGQEDLYRRSKDTTKAKAPKHRRLQGYLQ